jgi:hypothetical protein
MPLLEPSGSRWRLLTDARDVLDEQLVVAQGLVRTVSLAFQGLESFGSNTPAAYVVPMTGGSTQGHPDQMVREVMNWGVWGFVQAVNALDGSADSAREALLKAILDVVLGPDLQARLTDHFNANQSGAIEAYHLGGPDVLEQAEPEVAYFRLPCQAILHYRRGTL